MARLGLRETACLLASCVSDSAVLTVRGGMYCLDATRLLWGWAPALGRAPRVWLAPAQQAQGALLTH